MRMAARHVLVPLGVLAVAAWLFVGSPCRSKPILDVTSDVRRCSENLRAIHEGLIEYQKRTGKLPEGSSAVFLGALITSGVWQDTPENRARLSCPGPGAAPARADVDYRAAATLSSADTAYAVRDLAAFPLEKFPCGGREPLAACDDARGANHAEGANVLFADGSVELFTLEQEIASGRLPAGTLALPVGPASPIPELAKLRD